MYIFTAILSVSLIFALIKPAHFLGLVDKPDHRKSHVGEIPLVGGLGIVGAFTLSLSLFNAWHGFIDILIFPLLALFGISLLDDRLQLSARLRLVVQIIAATYLFLFGNVRITHLGNLLGFGDIHLGLPFSYTLTVMGIVGGINALNMSDGLDGLAGGISLVALVFFGFAANKVGLTQDCLQLFTMAAAVGGFLLLNLRTPWRSRAQVFMGDAGSMSLGLYLSCMAIRLSTPAAHALHPVSALWILALPITDTVVVMFRRILKGRNPFSPDQEHLHHILQRAGFSVQNTVFLLLTFSLVLGWIGLSGSWSATPDYLLFAGFMLVVFIHILITQHAWKVMRFIKSLRQKNQVEKLPAMESFEKPH